MTKDLLRDHRRVRKKLDCPKSMRNQFLADARHITDDFLAENPGATLDELQNAVGKPDQLAAMFLEGADCDAVEGYRKKKKWIKGIIAVFLAMVFISVTAFSIYAAYYRHAYPLSKQSTIIIYSTEEAAE